MTYKRSRSRDKSTTISVRVPRWLYEKLTQKVQNISQFVRKLLILELEGELTEEEQLEAKLDLLREEMDKLQEYKDTALKHGSYAKEYLNDLKDKQMVSHNPFYYSKKSTPTLKPEEQNIVEETTRLRNLLAQKYQQTLKRLIEIKRMKHISMREPELNKEKQTK